MFPSHLVFSCCLLAIVSGCSLAEAWHSKNTENVPKVENLDGRRRFVDCAEIRNYLHSFEGVVHSNSAYVAVDASINTNGQTNLQEEDVQESDSMKINDDAIFVLRTSDVVIVDRSNSSERGRIPIEIGQSNQMYLTETQLIVVSPSVVNFYELHKGGIPTLKNAVEINGTVVESRLKDNHLIVVTSSQVQLRNPDQDGSINGIRCNQIIVPYDVLSSASTLDGPRCGTFTPNRTLTGVYTFNVNSQGLSGSKLGILDNPLGVYITKNKIFAYQAASSKTHIRSIDIDPISGALALSATGTLPGYVRNKWAFKYHQAQNILNVSSTDWLYGPQWSQYNQINVLEENGQDLNVTAASESFGDGEDIKAIRYVDDLAYVVTFKNIDPLFTFDLSNPRQPTLIGAQKVPGFSTMLHNIGDRKLLGIGYETEDQGNFPWFQGVQVSLFDTTDLSSPSRLDVKVHGARGSYSEGNFDHHAVFYDQSRHVVGLPMVEFGESSSGNGNSFGPFKNSGAVFYSTANNNLSEITRVTHEDLMSDLCRQSRVPARSWQDSRIRSTDIRRIFSLGDAIYTLSPHGIKVYDHQLAHSRTLKFTASDDECRQLAHVSPD